MPTAATDVSLLLQVPPGTGLESVLELPAQSVAEPAIGGSAELTVMVFVALPQGVAYVIVTAPLLIPVTTPEAFTVALEGLLLLHVPPGTVLVSVMEEPTQTVLLPDMGAGVALTVTDFVLLHPFFV